MRLSKHFTLAEFTKSGIALRNKIDNTPNAEEIENMKRVAEEILEPVRREFGIPFSPSSGFRCQLVNSLAGSSDTSQHRTGNAVDFEIPGISNKVVADWIKANLQFDQLILEYHNVDEPNSGWIHISMIEVYNRQMCMVFDGNNYSHF